MHTPLTYVSLFSAAGLGCYGFKEAGFECVGTAELLPKRLEVQKANNVCSDDTAYYLGDLSSDTFLNSIVSDVQERTSDLTFVAATPPCQGMSVANHKKGDELGRNSLVVKSLTFIKLVRPRFFILENVRAFLSAACEDTDGVIKSISEAIDFNLSGEYSILRRIVNLKDYGSQSSRTRTIVIGVRRDIHDVTPADIFPEAQTPLTLAELIGDLPPLNDMGEISESDIYHSFRAYDPRMRPWISNLLPGESAFQNTDPSRRPHRVRDGERIENKNGNGDKYRRNRWDKVAPCVHTRNDILSSQSTVHPRDDRVFTVRELTRMMGVPESFKWTSFSLETLNSLPEEQKQLYIREHDTNIRQCLGEGVPTPVFRSVAEKTYAIANKGYKSNFARETQRLESINPRKKELSAYYTRQDTAYSLVELVSKHILRKKIRVLEPSVGAGAFLPSLFAVFSDKELSVEVIDIDNESITKVDEQFRSLPNNVSFRSTTGDFLNQRFEQKYDLVIGNPPFGSSGSVSGKFKLKDLFAKFLEKSLEIAEAVAFVVPKSFLSGKEYALLREHIASNYHIAAIEDYGETAFAQIKIETIGIVILNKVPDGLSTVVRSRLFLSTDTKPQKSVTGTDFPSWLLYRNSFFDLLTKRLSLGIFSVYRDRSITKAKLKTTGEIPVMKAKNITTNTKVNIDNYCDAALVPPKFWEQTSGKNTLVAPNLSYYPRACLLPPNTYVDGSAAVLIPNEKLSNVDPYLYFSSPEFFYYYRIARNFSVRSLNIDTVSVYFWGLPNEIYVPTLPSGTPVPSAKQLYNLVDLELDQPRLDNVSDD